MITSTLDKAIRSLRTLPAAEQDRLGELLLSYAAKWREFKAAIDRGTRELERGEGIEVNDIDAFLDSLSKDRHKA